MRLKKKSSFFNLQEKEIVFVSVVFCLNFWVFLGSSIFSAFVEYEDETHKQQTIIGAALLTGSLFLIFLFNGLYIWWTSKGHSSSFLRSFFATIYDEDYKRKDETSSSMNNTEWEFSEPEEEQIEVDGYWAISNKFTFPNGYAPFSHVTLVCNVFNISMLFCASALIIVDITFNIIFGSCIIS